MCYSVTSLFPSPVTSLFPSLRLLSWDVAASVPATQTSLATSPVTYPAISAGRPVTWTDSTNGATCRQFVTTLPNITHFVPRSRQRLPEPEPEG